MLDYYIVYLCKQHSDRFSHTSSLQMSFRERSAVNSIGAYCRMNKKIKMNKGKVEQTDGSLC
jgi:hypothetical protein